MTAKRNLQRIPARLEVLFWNIAIGLLTKSKLSQKLYLAVYSSLHPAGQLRLAEVEVGAGTD